MTLGAPSVPAMAQSTFTLNARLTSCISVFHRLINCCMIKISCQQLTQRGNRQNKVALLVFSEMREGTGKEWASKPYFGIKLGEKKGMEVC